MAESTKASKAEERVAVFRAAVAKDVIDLRQIQNLAFQGVPDAPGLRSLYWKLLLNYLPCERARWREVLDKNRATYKGFLAELIVDPHRATHQRAEDHPLSTSADSTWNAFFKDGEIVEEIDKDVRRTLPHLQFFATPQHSTALRQILFIYAKLNPGIRYVQGMNELLAPIYYLFASSSSLDPLGLSAAATSVTDTTPADSPPPAQQQQQQQQRQQQHRLSSSSGSSGSGSDAGAGLTNSGGGGGREAEADAFFVFSALMAEVRDGFCKSLDSSELGVLGLLERLSRRLFDLDPELWHDFDAKKLNPQFYSFRWITLLLSQEFELPDVLRLWDALFSDPRRFDLLYDVCCAMLTLLRETLLDGSFADNLKLLQNYPLHLHDIEAILARAVQLRDGTYQPPLSRPPPSQQLPQQPQTPIRATVGSAMRVVSDVKKLWNESAPTDLAKLRPQPLRDLPGQSAASGRPPYTAFSTPVAAASSSSYPASSAASSPFATTTTTSSSSGAAPHLPFVPRPFERQRQQHADDNNSRGINNRNTDDEDDDGSAEAAVMKLQLSDDNEPEPNVVVHCDSGTHPLG